MLIKFKIHCTIFHSFFYFFSFFLSFKNTCISTQTHRIYCSLKTIRDLQLHARLVCLNTLVPTHESLHCINPQMIYERKASNYLSDQFGLALACKYLMRIHASPRDDFWSSIFDFHLALKMLVEFKICFHWIK